MIEKEYGITLIVLIITIIIVLILSGITLSVTIGENGILTKAMSAKEEYRGAGVQEQVDMWRTEMKISKDSANSSCKTRDELVDELVAQKMLESREKDIILGNAEKGIEPEYEITIGSHTVSFLLEGERKAGLYDHETGELIKSWKELIEDGTITVDDGEIIGCNTSIKGDLVLSTTIETIKANAFNGCSGLTNIQIPSTVITIGGGAFYNVPHVYYEGTATGSPWGAKAIN